MRHCHIRWSQLMADLEAVVNSAHAMQREGDITEEQYQHLNHTIGNLEMKVRDWR